MRDVRAQRLWDRVAFESLLSRHFSEENYQQHPILDRSPGRFDADQQQLELRCIRGLNSAWNHLGTSHICFADLAILAGAFESDLSDDTAARTLTCIDWQLLGLRQRLAGLDRMRAETRHGWDWLAGSAEPMPSFRSLPTLQDKFSFIAVKTVGRYFDVGDARQVSKLRTAFDGGADSQLVCSVTRLAESALTRGCKLSPVVPRLILLREAGHEFGLRALVYIAARHLVELSNQYAERAGSERDHAFCCQIALTFLLEAAIHRPEDQSFVAHAAEEVLKSALYLGLPSSMLMPLYIGAA